MKTRQRRNRHAVVELEPARSVILVLSSRPPTRVACDRLCHIGRRCRPKALAQAQLIGRWLNETALGLRSEQLLLEPVELMLELGDLCFELLVARFEGLVGGEQRAAKAAPAPRENRLPI